MKLISIRQDYRKVIYQLDFIFNEADRYCFVVNYYRRENSHRGIQIRGAETINDFLGFIELTLGGEVPFYTTFTIWKNLTPELLKMSTRASVTIMNGAIVVGKIAV